MSDLSKRLTEARERAGYSKASHAAEAMGISVSSYIQHENGTRHPRRGPLERYANFFRVTPDWLEYGKGSGEPFINLGKQLFVKGEVAAGVWKESWELPEDEWLTFTGRADINIPQRRRFGLRIIGDSMNEIYPPGSIVECIQFTGEEQLVTGKRVIVQRTNTAGATETTVKELVIDDDGVHWLVPRSRNPAFQTPIRCDVAEPGIATVEIIGVVVASIRPE